LIETYANKKDSGNKIYIRTFDPFRIIQHMCPQNLDIGQLQTRDRAKKPLDNRFLVAGGGSSGTTLVVRDLVWIYFQVCAIFVAAPAGAAAVGLLADVLRHSNGMHLADVRDSQKQAG
jgi:hypothetical protein